MFIFFYGLNLYIIDFVVVADIVRTEIAVVAKEIQEAISVRTLSGSSRESVTPLFGDIGDISLHFRRRTPAEREAYREARAKRINAGEDVDICTIV